MNKEEAYERLELEIGVDLNVVRQKFASMHNDYRMQIDNAFNPTSKRIFEQKLEELKEAYAVLNESKGIDDNASLPRISESFDTSYNANHSENGNDQMSIDEALLLFGLDRNLNDKSIVEILASYLVNLNQELAKANLSSVKNAYKIEIQHAEVARDIVLNWLSERVVDQETREVQEEEQSIVEEVEKDVPQASKVKLNTVLPSYSAERVTDKNKSFPFGIMAILVLLVLGLGYYFIYYKSNTTDPVKVEDTKAAQNDVLLKADSTAWKVAQAAKNEEAYSFYIKEYPKGIFIADAENSLKQLIASKVVQPKEEVVEKKVEIPKNEITPSIQSIVAVSSSNQMAKLASKVRFKFDSSVIEPMSVLDEIAAYMRENSGNTYQFKVYSDEGNSSDYELRISKKRGDAIKQYLINAGVPPSSISIAAYGNSKSTCHDNTPRCYNKNNRIEIEEF